MLVAVLSALSNLSAEPIWANDGARYALFRREIPLADEQVKSATIHVAAAQSGPLEKLLAAYRLYVDGVAIGIGPGRGETRTAAYPDGGGVNHTFYDSFSITVKSPTLVLDLQCYHASGDATADCNSSVDAV